MSEPKHRLLYALAPSMRERALMALLRDAIAGPVSPVSNERLHVTLAITNDFPIFPTEAANRMIAIADTVSAAPFRLSLDRLSGGTELIALRPSHRCAPLSELQQQLGDGLRRWNLARKDCSFSSHSTLLYWQGQPFLQPIPPIVLDVTDFVLVHSLLGQTRHVELGRWSLVSRQFSLPF